MNLATTNISTDTHALYGAWGLISFYFETPEGERSYPFGESPQGVLIYTDSGDISAQLMGDNRPQFKSGDQLKGTTQEIEQSFRNYIAYFGKYEIDVTGGYVVHHVEKSLFPNWEGKPQKRYFELSGNQLRISTPPISWDGEERVGVLLWQRSK